MVYWAIQTTVTGSQKQSLEKKVKKNLEQSLHYQTAVRRLYYIVLER